MDDEIARRQGLHLIKAFLSITDARKRQRILNLAEQLADDAASSTAALAAADVSNSEGCGDATGRVE